MNDAQLLTVACSLVRAIVSSRSRPRRRALPDQIRAQQDPHFRRAGVQNDELHGDGLPGEV